MHNGSSRLMLDLQRKFDEMIRKFLTKTARSQKKTILFFRDPFALVPVNNIAEIADKFTRNEILSSNEIRQVIGRKPSDDPKADQLINSNISQSKDDPRINTQPKVDSSSEKSTEGEEIKDTIYGNLPKEESDT